MAPIRLRHPKGVSTLQIPFEQADYTVQDLQQEIYAASKILPSRQTLKTGYPPRDLTIVPELPLSSLGLKAGDQIIVSGDTESSSSSQSDSTTPTSQSSRTVASRAAPLSSTSAIPRTTYPTGPSTNGPEHVITDGGVLVHRVVPDDNSCLFSSIALVFEQDTTKATKIREIVAEGIEKDQETYNEGILGMSPSKYISTILKPNTWGGAIELSILASHYRTEICSIDVETGRIDHFSPPDGAIGGNRCLLIYSGIHYDAATLAPVVDAPTEWHQTVFPVTSTDADSDEILKAGKKLADALRAKKAYTNTTTFSLKCQDCGKGLTGEKEAREHASQTGHVRFGEY
ncbi:OTU-domain-containing protein [Dendrothele bispora CBS 962.96]|uniref:Ubiquitin thioesterase OTU n=1 Tax=Dendrothele bispora (strain CBS 962.96) TaxID=1314807 RepID=A0A4S8MNS4_DENBC|nr:OTU-domain-containing protein [Dendrothele bispora CBS 962.96]